MALGDKNYDNDPLGESLDELRFAKPIRRRPSEKVADQIAAFQQKHLFLEGLTMHQRLNQWTARSLLKLATPARTELNG